MHKVVLNSRDGKFKFEKEFTEGKTVNDIKEYLSENIKIVYDNVEKDSIFIFYNENVLNDTLVLSHFESPNLDLLFDYTKNDLNKHEDNIKGCNKIKDEVRTNPINTKITSPKINSTNIPLTNTPTNSLTKIPVRVTENGAEIYVEPTDLITKDNKTYLIKKRTKILNLKFIIEVIKNFRISREDILKFIVFSFLLFTNNGEVLFILGSIFLLQIASSALIKYKRNFTKKMEHINRTILMFVVSLFMIDHNRI